MVTYWVRRGELLNVIGFVPAREVRRESWTASGYVDEMRASFATNHGNELMPMGENGKGTFFNACACTVALDQRNKTRNKIIRSLRTALGNSGQNVNFRDPVV